MKYASEDLMNEHEAILKGLSILEKIASRVASGKLNDQADPVAMINFLKLFADTYHHGKEETILFPALEKHGVSKERGPIGKMLTEHEEGRKYIRAMSESTEKKPFDTKAFVVNATGYIELLRSHIQKENIILFPMGDRALPDAEQKRILEAFENYEQTVIGHGIHEKLHVMLDNFSKKYQ